MSIENHNLQEVNDSTSVRPARLEGLHDPVQNLRDLITLTKNSKTSESAASLDNLATADVYSSSTAKSSERSKSQLEAHAATERKAHDGSTTRSESVERTDKHKPQDMAQERQHLTDWADKNLKEPKLSQFKKDMTDFETRADRDGLPPDEVAKTYEQIERLSDAKGDKPLSQIQRQDLAAQVMHQAANPTSIDQGMHNTCSVTSVETRTYTRTPSESARLVAEVALTGKYSAADGTEVKTNPQPHDESHTGENLDGRRSHASEIFQVTAVNLHYAKENAKNGTHIHYEQVEPVKGDDADTGERLMDYSKHPAQEVKVDDDVIRQPNLKDGDITEISNAITGKKETDVQLEAADNVNGDKAGIMTVNNEAELKDKLKDLKDHHQLPVIITVNTFNEPFYTDSLAGAAGGAGGQHAVTITDYDEKTGNVCVDNQWGKGADHGKDNPVSAHDLFIAMQTPEDAQKSVAGDVQTNAKNGVDDPARQLELDRYKQYNEPGSVSAKDVENALQDTEKRWANGSVSDAERAKERHELNELIANLPLLEERSPMLSKEHDLGITNDGQYENQLALVGMAMIHPDKYDPVTDKIKADYNTALGELTPDQRQAVLHQVNLVKNALANPEQQAAVQQEVIAWMNNNGGT